MIRFNKKDICYALINNTTRPDLLLPVKCRVIDYTYNPNRLSFYTIQIIEMYDTLNFIRENWLNYAILYSRRSSENSDEVSIKKLPNLLRNYKFETKEDMYNVMHNDVDVNVDAYGVSKSKKKYTDYKERHYIIVYEQFMFHTKSSAYNVRNKITDFKIIETLRELKLYSTLTKYDSKLKISSNKEFNDRTKKLYNLTDEKLINLI